MAISSGPGIDERTPTPSGITYSLETLAALIVHRLGRTDLLKENRDAFVGAAKRLGLRRDQGVAAVFLSYTSSDAVLARRLADALDVRGISVVSVDNIRAGGQALDELEVQINRAQHMIVLVGRDASTSRGMEQEVRAFQRQSSSEDGRVRFLVPVLLPGASSQDVPRQLMHFKNLVIEGATAEALESVADQIGSIVTIEPPTVA